MSSFYAAAEVSLRTEIRKRGGRGARVTAGARQADLERGAER